jgi:4-amino-4-deoxy-L-arabinose transferase-like glycosyltransferase
VSAELPAVTRIERDAVALDVSWLASIRTDALLMLMLFIAAIIPRAAWTAYTDRAPRGLDDAVFYNLYGLIIARGHGYTRPTGEKFAYFPVGYPATLAGLKKAGDIFGWRDSIFSAKMMNGMFGAITVLLIYLLATRIFSRRVGVAAGLLLAIFPNQVYDASLILSDTEFTMLFVAGLLVLLWHPWTRDGMSWQRLLTTGVIFSAATMVRGILLVFPLVLLALWLPYLHSKRRAVTQTLIVFAGILVFVVPWSVRNTVVFGQLTGPSLNLGDDLCIGNNLRAHGSYALEDRCFKGYDGLSPSEVELRRNAAGVRIAVHDVLARPFRMPKLIGQKAYWLLYRDDDGLFAAEAYGYDEFIGLYRREVLGYAANSIYYAVGSVAILGAPWFAFGKDIRRAFIMLTLLYVLAIPLVFFGATRFHFPAIPLIVLVAASTTIAIWDRRLDAVWPRLVARPE